MQLSLYILALTHCITTGSSGILGTGNTNELHVPPIIPIDLGDNFEVEQLYCIEGHCCTVSSHKTLKCWGQCLYIFNIS